MPNNDYDVQRLVWPVVFQGMQRDDQLRIYSAIELRYAKDGSAIRADDGVFLKAGSGFMLSFKKPVTQSQAEDAMMKIVSSKDLGSAFSIRPHNKDAIQIVNWKLPAIKKEKAETEAPAPAKPALTAPTAPTPTAVKPAPPSTLEKSSTETLSPLMQQLAAMAVEESGVLEDEAHRLFRQSTASGKVPQKLAYDPITRAPLGQRLVAYDYKLDAKAGVWARKNFRVKISGSGNELAYEITLAD